MFEDESPTMKPAEESADGGLHRGAIDEARVTYTVYLHSALINLLAEN